MEDKRVVIILTKEQYDKAEDMRKKFGYKKVQDVIRYLIVKGDTNGKETY